MSLDNVFELLFYLYSQIAFSFTRFGCNMHLIPQVIFEGGIVLVTWCLCPACYWGVTSAPMGPTVFVGFLVWEGRIVWGLSRAALGPGRVVAGVGIVRCLGFRVSGHVALYSLE